MTFIQPTRLYQRRPKSQ